MWSASLWREALCYFALALLFLSFRDFLCCFLFERLRESREERCVLFWNVSKLRFDGKNWFVEFSPGRSSATISRTFFISNHHRIQNNNVINTCRATLHSNKPMSRTPAKEASFLHQNLAVESRVIYHLLSYY